MTALLTNAPIQQVGLLGFGRLLHDARCDPENLTQPDRQLTISGVAHFADSNGYPALCRGLRDAASENHSLVATTIDQLRETLKQDTDFFQNFVTFLEPEEILLNHELLGAAVLYSVSQTILDRGAQNMTMSLALFPQPAQSDAPIADVLTDLSEIHNVNLLSPKAVQQRFQDNLVAALNLYQWLVIIDEHFNGVGNPTILSDLLNLGIVLYLCKQSERTQLYYEQLVELMKRGAYGIDVLKKSNHYLAALLGKHKGHQTKAAQELGLARPTVCNRVRNAKPGSLLAPFKKVHVSDIELADLLRKHKGNQTKVAQELGLAPPTVGNRVRNAKPGSLLAPFKKVHVSDIELADLLRKHKGNQAKAAQESGLSPSAFSRRIKDAGPKSPLAHFKRK